MRLKKFLVLISIFVITGVMAFADPFEYRNSLGITSTSNALNSYTKETVLWGIEYEHWFDSMALGFGGNIIVQPEKINFADFQIFTTISESLFSVSIGHHSGGRLFVFETLGARGFVKNNFVVDGMFSAGFGFDYYLNEHLNIPIKVCLLGEIPHDIGVGFGFGLGIRYNF